MPILTEDFFKEALHHKMERCAHSGEPCKFCLDGFCYFESYKYSTIPMKVEVGNMDCYEDEEVMKEYE